MTDTAPEAGSRPRSWVYRRITVAWALAYSSGLLMWLAICAPGTDLQLRIADGMVTVMIVTVAAYIGGATADDFLRDKGMPK